jgi:hypothetical protein
MNLHAALRILIRPTVCLPVLLAAALLFVAISLGDIGQVLDRVKAIAPASLLLVLAFAAIYLLLKGMQLHLLLTNLGAHPGWRRFALAFAVGELALTLPLGIFAQNWVLTSADTRRFGRSSAATVVMLLMEVVAVLLWLAVFGVPGWPPLQPAAAGVLLGLGVLVFGVLRFEAGAERLAHKLRQRHLHRALLQGIGLLRGLKRLANWRVLGVNLLVTFAYLGALAAAFLVLGRGVGVPRLDYHDAATIYAFALAAILLCGGLFGQIGTVEVIGMSVARAFGIGYTDGLALMLGFRLAWTGAMWLLNGPVAWHYRHAMQQDAESMPPSVEDGEKPAH